MHIKQVISMILNLNLVYLSNVNLLFGKSIHLATQEVINIQSRDTSQLSSARVSAVTFPPPLPEKDCDCYHPQETSETYQNTSELKCFKCPSCLISRQGISRPCQWCLSVRARMVEMRDGARLQFH